MEGQDQLLTVREVAEELQISRMAAYRLIQSGGLAAVVLSPRATRIRRSTLDRWIDEREQTQAAQ